MVELKQIDPLYIDGRDIDRGFQAFTEGIQAVS